MQPLYIYNFTIPLKYNSFDINSNKSDAEYVLGLDKDLDWTEEIIRQPDMEDAGEHRLPISDSFQTKWKVSNVYRGEMEQGDYASEFLLSVTDIIASSGEEAEKLLEPTLSKLCNTLSFLLAVDNYNKQSFQPKVYPDWGSAGRDHKRLLPEEKQDGQTIYRDENGKEHIVYTITSGIEIGASVYFRIFGKMQTELFWKYYNLTDPRALYLMEEYCAALGTEQIRSKFFHLFCMIEFVEREYKELAKLECLLSEGQIADICSHAEETLKMDSSMDRNIRENITSILKSRMMQITTKGRAKTLEGILSAMGIERIQDGGNEFKVDAARIGTYIDFRNRLFHGNEVDAKLRQVVTELMNICLEITQYAVQYMQDIL